MQSKYLDSTAAVSETDSEVPSWMSFFERVSGCPPSLVIPTSNETLVRVEGFSYIEPIAIPASG